MATVFKESDRLRYVTCGQKVTFVLDSGKGLPCVVVKATGDLAQITAESGALAKSQWWVEIDRLFPELPPEARKRLSDQKKQTKKRGPT